MATQMASMPDRNDDTGRYTDEYPPSAFTEAIAALGGSAGTQEVADEVGCIYDTAYKKLRSLEDSGKINSRKVANARLWELAED